MESSQGINRRTGSVQRRSLNSARPMQLFGGGSAGAGELHQRAVDPGRAENHAGHHIHCQNARRRSRSRCSRTRTAEKGEGAHGKGSCRSKKEQEEGH